MSKTPKIFDPTYPDGRLDAPAFHRNHEPIWSVDDLPDTHLRMQVAALLSRHVNAGHVSVVRIES